MLVIRPIAMVPSPQANLRATAPDFGQYAPRCWRRSCLRMAQRMPVNWLGRRLALLLRRLTLLGWSGPMDALAEDLRLRVQFADNVSERKFLFMPQFCDPTERNYLRDHLRNGEAFIDIGANAGIYTLTAAQAMDRKRFAGPVIAIEPNPVMLERLTRNVIQNAFESRVKIVAAAVGSETGTTQFTLSSTNLGESGLNKGTGQTISVTCDTLLNILRTRSVTAISGIKIDVEGHEDTALLPFFRDSPPSLWPRFIIIENSSDQWRSDLHGFLQSIGYKLHAKLRMNSIFVLQSSAETKLPPTPAQSS